MNNFGNAAPSFGAGMNFGNFGPQQPSFGSGLVEQAVVPAATPFVAGSEPIKTESSIHITTNNINPTNTTSSAPSATSAPVNDEESDLDFESDTETNEEKTILSKEILLKILHLHPGVKLDEASSGCIRNTATVLLTQIIQEAQLIREEMEETNVLTTAHIITAIQRLTKSRHKYPYNTSMFK